MLFLGAQSTRIGVSDFRTSKVLSRRFHPLVCGAHSIYKTKITEKNRGNTHTHAHIVECFDRLSLALILVYSSEAIGEDVQSSVIYFSGGYFFPI